MKNFYALILILAFIVQPGNALAVLTQTQVSQLYVAIFGRASEGEGNAYWQTDPNSTDMATAANVMLATQPAKDYFGTTMNSNAAFVSHIYLNTLGKTFLDDPSGQTYWIQQLNDGTPKGEMISALIQAAQAPENAGNAQTMFNNKVQVSDYCANAISSFSDVATFTAYIAGVTQDAATVNAAKSSIDADAASAAPACINLSGKSYTMTEIRYLSSCGGGTDVDSFYVHTVEQNGCSVTFLDSYGVWGTGTLTGNTATVNSSWTEVGGTVNAVYDVIFSGDGSSFEGSGKGTYNTGSTVCYPTSSISGE